MNQTIIISAVLFIALVLFLLAALLYGLRHAFRLGSLPPERQGKMLFYVGLGVVFWLAFLAGLVYYYSTGIYR